MTKQRLAPHGLDALSQKRPSSMPAKRLTTFIFNEEDPTSPKHIPQVEESIPSVSTMESSERQRELEPMRLNVPLIKDIALEDRPGSVRRSRKPSARAKGNLCTRYCCNSQENSFCLPTHPPAHPPTSKKRPLRPTDKPNRPPSASRGKALYKKLEADPGLKTDLEKLFSAIVKQARAWHVLPEEVCASSLVYQEFLSRHAHILGA